MRDLKVYIGFFLLLLIAYLFVQYNAPQSIDWQPSFKRTDKIPFGTYILHRELAAQLEGKLKLNRQSIYQTIQRQYDQHFNLLIIAPRVEMSSTEYTVARRALSKGNDLFIATQYLPKDILDSLKIDFGVDRDVLGKNPMRFNFTNPLFKQEEGYTYDRNLGNYYFSELDSMNCTVLARNDAGKAVFIRFRYGLGNLYLMSSPDFFSNYALLSPRGMDFASKALSYLPKHRPLLLDEYQTRGREGDTDVFSVLYRYPQLSWAYYLALISLALFVLYEVKRRQRIIPIKDPMANTSIEFAKVVGDIYLQQHNNKDIAHKKALFLLENIRSGYGLKTSQLNKEFIDTLSSRCAADPVLIARICKEINELYKGKYPNDDELITLSIDIDNFYQQSGLTWNKNLNKEKI